MRFLFWLALAAMGAGRLTGAQADEERTWVPARALSPLRLYRGMSPAIEYSELRIRAGDDARWAQPEWDDRGWSVLARTNLPAVPAHAGILWLRYRVRWNSGEGRLPDGVHIWSLFGSYEFFWDGVLLGRSGVPGADAEREEAGPSRSTFVIPEASNGVGEHLVALRLSTHRAPRAMKAMVPSMIMIAPAALDAHFRRDNVLPVMASGAMLTIALASFVMWVVVGRQLVLLLLSALCLSSGAFVALKWFSLAYVYPHTWHRSLQWGITGTAFALSLSLCALVMEEWSVPRKRALFTALLLAGVALVVGKMPILVPSAQFIGGALGFVLLCSAWAIRRRRHGAWIVGTVVAASGALLVHDPMHWVGTDFFHKFLPVVLSLLVMIALRLRRERKQALETKLTAARMEIELLKKNLHPHFLMNTLTALAQTVEENPARAVKLIDDLALEFRTLASMSAQKAVSLARELELCRAHLRVMRARTDVAWALEFEGVDATASVPPALFLTLIENGFSHQRPRAGDVTFSLRAAGTKEGVRYTFVSPGTVTEATNRVAGGTGLSYVRARLEESFPGAWSLSQGAVAGGWETVIELRRPVRSGSLA